MISNIPQHSLDDLKKLKVKSKKDVKIVDKNQEEVIEMPLDFFVRNIDLDGFSKCLNNTYLTRLNAAATSVTSPVKQEEVDEFKIIFHEGFNSIIENYLDKYVEENSFDYELSYYNFEDVDYFKGIEKTFQLYSDSNDKKFYLVCADLSSISNTFLEYSLLEYVKQTLSRYGISEFEKIVEIKPEIKLGGYAINEN